MARMVLHYELVDLNSHWQRRKFGFFIFTDFNDSCMTTEKQMFTYFDSVVGQCRVVEGRLPANIDAVDDIAIHTLHSTIDK